MEAVVQEAQAFLQECMRGGGSTAAAGGALAAHVWAAVRGSVPKANVVLRRLVADHVTATTLHAQPTSCFEGFEGAADAEGHGPLDVVVQAAVHGIGLDKEFAKAPAHLQLQIANLVPAGEISAFVAFLERHALEFRTRFPTDVTFPHIECSQIAAVCTRKLSETEHSYLIGRFSYWLLAVLPTVFKPALNVSFTIRKPTISPPPPTDEPGGAKVVPKHASFSAFRTGVSDVELLAKEELWNPFKVHVEALLSACSGQCQVSASSYLQHVLGNDSVAVPASPESFSMQLADTTVRCQVLIMLLFLGHRAAVAESLLPGERARPTAAAREDCVRWQEAVRALLRSTIAEGRTLDFDLLGCLDAETSFIHWKREILDVRKQTDIEGLSRPADADVLSAEKDLKMVAKAPRDADLAQTEFSALVGTRAPQQGEIETLELNTEADASGEGAGGGRDGAAVEGDAAALQAWAAKRRLAARDVKALAGDAAAANPPSSAAAAAAQRSTKMATEAAGRSPPHAHPERRESRKAEAAPADAVTIASSPVSSGLSAETPKQGARQHAVAGEAHQGHVLPKGSTHGATRGGQGLSSGPGGRRGSPVMAAVVEVDPEVPAGGGGKGGPAAVQTRSSPGRRERLPGTVERPALPANKRREPDDRGKRNVDGHMYEEGQKRMRHDYTRTTVQEGTGNFRGGNGRRRGDYDRGDPGREYSGRRRQ